ncbi:MAG: nicotinate-nucleotide adenylyltransferase [Chthoniobacteraceae bacterium]
MRTALYGGSFDPIHHGHLILAREAMERLALDRVIFIPAAQSPHKLARTPSSPQVRLAMVQAAIGGEPRFECDPSETEREGPSFTVDTVEAWRAKAPGDELFCLIGEDNVRELPTWRRYEELRGMVQFVVFGRGAYPAHGADSVFVTIDLEAPAPLWEMPVIQRRVDISATDVRKRVAQGRSIRYLVPEAAREIIETHRLYQGETH